MFRHPLLGRITSTFILSGSADTVSQLFLSSPPRVDPDQTVRFASCCSMSVVPVWFGYNRFVGTDTSILARIGIETFVLGPMYLGSLLWTNGVIATRDVMEGSRIVRREFLSLYWDAVRVVPVYSGLIYFAVAPHMRGYALTACQFGWNMYVSWFVSDTVRNRLDR